jgi:hypothetical protein
MAIKNFIQLLSDKADYLLNYTSETIDKSALHLRSPNHIDDISGSIVIAIIPCYVIFKAS